jgi:hypothetical protein
LLTTTFEEIKCKFIFNDPTSGLKEIDKNLEKLDIHDEN